MLRYIVSRLREQALSSDCQYISATIFDGLNNLIEKKASNLLEAEKGLKPRKTKVTMFDHTKTLKEVGENGRQPRPQWPGCFCRKMCCPNGSRKMHFVQKIHPDPSSHYMDLLYFPHVVRFSVAIEATIFRTRRLMLCSNQGKGPHSWGRP